MHSQVKPSTCTSVSFIDSPKINKYQGDPVERRLTQGNNETFHCDIKSGMPDPTITFYFGETGTKKVDKEYDARFSHPTEEEWTITGIKTEDKGTYRCVAENIAGNDTLIFKITEVDGKFFCKLLYHILHLLSTDFI